MQLRIPRLFFKSATSCFVMVSHIALSHGLILCWCQWLVRLHVISALFLMQSQQHFISLYFGQSLLMLMTISVFCVCECVRQCLELCEKDHREDQHASDERRPVASAWPQGRGSRGGHGHSDLSSRRSRAWVSLFYFLTPYYGFLTAAVGVLYIDLVFIVVFDCLSVRLNAEQSSSESELQELRAATMKAMWV